MASLKATKVTKSLSKKGFIKAEGDHHYYEFWHNDVMIARTKTSHNNQDINDYLISAMSKQCIMDKNFFIAFANCTKSKDDYLELLRRKGEI
ncbi:hypothetical protein FC093_20145 [Ilyomonas limi]|uniref:Type II toxin-antitoxin system HicA family toxin n=1 Tax=Ilyomonas limi TaxID=2575867 RepID=A0A4U3KV43_9BACT|nr:hypothetical protein [Ilyomonas limi]TKK65424.1 hypothetical protein FC093_20145 [Ilyomonas limi]